MDRVLVTGGAGFIGSHQVEYLLAKGYRVRVLDDLSTGHREFVPAEAEFLQGSILDRDTCRKATQGVRGIIHLAAMSKVGPSLAVPELCIQANVVGTMNVALSAVENQVPAFVYAGSSTVYGRQAPPHHPALPPDCLNPYAASKYMGERVVENFHRCYRLNALSLRYFNVYGERQPDSGPYALVLGIFLRRAAEGRPLVVHGDGSQKRDFIHVSDVVEANYRALLKLWGGPEPYEVLNVGTGKSVSILELARAISPRVEFGPRRPGDAPWTEADISRTVELLNWTPQVDLQQTLGKLLEKSSQRTESS